MTLVAVSGEETVQNRFVGDIGDYLKLSILRALSPGHRLGVAWWRHPDEAHNRDGRHIGYLQWPDRWRRFDPELFDALAEIVRSSNRTVAALQATNLLLGAVFASEPIPIAGPAGLRQQSRRQWFARAADRLADADLVFVDPDNGLEPSRFSHGSTTSGKNVLLSELLELVRPGRSLIVYHHHTRRVGGHHAEIAYWAERLRGTGFSTVDALRAKPYSPRVYFLLDAPPDLRQRTGPITIHWEGLVTWHPQRDGGPSGTSD
jgi:hypothetical protein